MRWGELESEEEESEEEEEEEEVRGPTLLCVLCPCVLEC